MNLLCGCCILFSGYFASYRASGKVALCLGAHNSDVAICMQVMLAKFRTERCAVKQIVCETKAEYRAAMQEMLLMQELQFDKIVRFFGGHQARQRGAVDVHGVHALLRPPQDPAQQRASEDCEVRRIHAVATEAPEVG